MDNNKLSRLSHLIIVAAGAVIFLSVTIKYLLPAVLPVLAALIISSVTRPVAGAIAKKSKMPYKLCGIVITSLIIFFVAYAAVLLGEKLIHEMTDFVRSLMESLDREDNPIRRAFEFAEKFREKIPLLSSEHSAYSAHLYELIMDWAKSAAASVSESFAKGTASFISTLPNLVFAAVVSVIALFYLTADFDGVKSGVAKLIPDTYRKKFKGFSDKLGTALSGYIKAYLTLMLITFAELFFGFVILRIRYAFFLAIIIAVIDVLPVLGVGTVLVPWALMLFIGGNSGRAVGLLILLGIMYAVRQFTEPRLVGRFMGIHPLLTLTGAFAGYSLFGLWGMLLSPVILYGIKLSAEAMEKDR